ncbi:MAG: VCBS domain-containing protein, partial [Steroidobacteraceae bacterium]
MSEITGTDGNNNLNGGSGDDVMDGGAGNDVMSGGSGSDIMDGGSGSDRLNGGSGTDTLIYTLGENSGATDIYTGGSGIDTVRLELTSAEWVRADVQTEIAQYLQHLNAVKSNQNTGEVSNGYASDFTFVFSDGARLTVQMMEKLEVWVDGQQFDFHAPFVTAADDAGAVTEDAADPTLSDSGTIDFIDVDWTQSHSASVTSDSGNSLGGTLTAVVSDAATGDGNGVVTWSYSVANSATQHLGVGDTATEIFTVTITD